MGTLLAPERCDRPELLDRPAHVLDQLPGNLDDIRRLNRWFGGISPFRRRLRDLGMAARTVTLLDVGTGSGDVPLALIRDARRHGFELAVTAVDASDEILDEARRYTAGENMTLAKGDARRLPWPDGRFDVVICSLMLHHLPPRDAVTVLRELWRTARALVVVSDLRRSYAGYAAAWLATRTVARNPVTRHDAPLSVLRSYSGEELRRLAADAGWTDIEYRRTRFFRQSLVGRKWAPRG